MFTLDFWKNIYFFYKFAIKKTELVKGLVAPDGAAKIDRAVIACKETANANHAAAFILGKIPEPLALANPKIGLAKKAGASMGLFQPFFDAACPFIVHLKPLRKLIPNFLKKAFAIAVKVWEIHETYMKFSNPWYLAYRAGKAIYDSKNAKRKEKKAREISRSIKSYVRAVMEGMDHIHESNNRMERALSGYYMRRVSYGSHLNRHSYKER